MRAKTQTERVIAAARSFRGVCQVDFLGPVIVDGGKPITRLAARIFDAERDGYTFEVIAWRDRCKVYRLASDPDGVERGTAAPPPPRSCASLSTDEPDESTLFTPPTRPHWDEAA